MVLGSTLLAKIMLWAVFLPHKTHTNPMLPDEALFALDHEIAHFLLCENLSKYALYKPICAYLNRIHIGSPHRHHLLHNCRADCMTWCGGANGCDELGSPRPDVITDT